MSSLKNATTEELIDELATRTDADPRSVHDLVNALLTDFAMVSVFEVPAENIGGTSLLFKWGSEVNRNVVMGNITPLLLSVHDTKKWPFP